MADWACGKPRQCQSSYKLKLDAIPYHAKPFPIPWAREETTCEETESLCHIGVLKKCNDSYGEPLLLSYQKNDTVHFIWTSES